MHGWPITHSFLLALLGFRYSILKCSTMQKLYPPFPLEKRDNQGGENAPGMLPARS
jgi:hypothetical protein